MPLCGIIAVIFLDDRENSEKQFQITKCHSNFALTTLKPCMIRLLPILLCPNSDEADNCYDEILKIDPNNTGAIGDKGTVECYRGNFKEGIRFFDLSLKIEPNNISG